MRRSSLSVALLVVLSACPGNPHDPPGDGGIGGDAAAANVLLPPANAGLDYQLGGAYSPAPSVGIVSRDRGEAPAPGKYNVCYVNGFQIQENEAGAWMTDHPDLILRDSMGMPVVDTAWNEMLIDVSSPAKRSSVAAIVGAWIAGCASAGFDAVEIDNLDSYTRSGGRLAEDDAVAMVRAFADAAHAHGLAIAQKNASELVPRRAEMATDFVVAESCNEFAECGDYIAGYGTHVLMIEYAQADFATGCSTYPAYSIVLRDLNLTTPGNGAYVYDGC